MYLSAEIWNEDSKYAYKKTMQNFWLKAVILTLDMMEVLRNPRTNNESVDTNTVTHDVISQDAGARIVWICLVKKKLTVLIARLTV